MWYNDCYEEPEKDNHMDDLYNEILAGVANPKRAFVRYDNNKFNKLVRRNFLRDMLGAQRFYISDSLLQSAIVASYSHPKAILGMLRQAKPPFNNMWIEWDERKRMHLTREYLIGQGMQMEGIDRSEQAQKVGYRIHRTQERDKMFHWKEKSSDWEKPIYPEDSFCYQGFIKMGKVSKHGLASKILFAPLSLTMSNEQEMEWMKRFPVKHYNKAFMETIYPIMGYTYTQMHPNNTYLSNCVRQLATGVHELHTFNYGMERVAKWNQEGDITPFEKWMDTTVSTSEGDIRFIISVLALLNYQHHVYERADMASIPRRIRYGGIVPRNELRVLEIDLPKPFGVKKYEKIFKGFGSPKRQHTRRGHWHTYHYKNGEKRQKWVEEQTVGNPELGKIEHDYILRRRNG
tara:strand:+ start:583 stop:1791 length:1209 start_codon:yes stop_codon:yes gene_type:complete